VLPLAPAAGGGTAAGTAVVVGGGGWSGPGTTFTAIEKFGSVTSRTVARSLYTFMIRPTRPPFVITGMPTCTP
jgi:hypothetical protein